MGCEVFFLIEKLHEIPIKDYEITGRSESILTTTEILMCSGTPFQAL